MVRSHWVEMMDDIKVATVQNQIALGSLGILQSVINADDINFARADAIATDRDTVVLMCGIHAAELAFFACTKTSFAILIRLVRRKINTRASNFVILDDEPDRILPFPDGLSDIVVKIYRKSSAPLRRGARDIIEDGVNCNLADIRIRRTFEADACCFRLDTPLVVIASNGIFPLFEIILQHLDHVLE